MKVTDRPCCAAISVITSYSIHYTKLYEGPVSRGKLDVRTMESIGAVYDDFALFQTFNGDVEILPVMSEEDLQVALSRVAL